MTRLPFTALDWATWAGEMAAQAAVLVTALRLPRRDRPHVPMFVFVLAAEVWMRAVQETIFVPASGQSLFGSLRALYHVETGLVTAWQAAVAALAWWVWRGPEKSNAPGRTSEALSGCLARGRILLTLPLAVKTILLLWVVFNAALIASHPLPRGWTQPALHAFAGLCVVLGGLAIVTGWSRRHERAAQVAGYLVVVEGVVAIVGPWAGNVFVDWRTVGAAMYWAAFTLLAGWQWRVRQKA